MVRTAGDMGVVTSAISMLLKRKVMLFVFFLLIAYLFNAITLFKLGITSDEATYLIIGRAIFNGKTYLVDLWDFKPIGIFVIYGLVQNYIMDSIYAVRILGVIVIAGSSFLVYLIKIKFGATKNIAIWGGVFYPLLVFFINPNYILNTEIYFNFFTLIGFYVLLSYNNLPGLILSGLALGVGFMVKYINVFDTIIIYVFYISGLYHNRIIKFNFQNFKKSIMAFFAFLVPFALVNLYYYKIDAYQIFFNSTFKTSKVYSDGMSLVRELRFVGDFIATYFPLLILFFVFVMNKMKKGGRDFAFGLFSLLWLVFAMIPILLQGKHYVHYYVQAAVPLCLFSADGYVYLKRTWMKKILIIIFVFYTGYSFYNQVRVYNKSKNLNAKVADILRPLIMPEDNIYSNIQAMYYYLDKLPPTGIVHQSIILSGSHNLASGIDKGYEIDLIFNTKPEYVILKNGFDESFIKDKLEIGYNKITEYDNRIRLYKRK